MERFEFTPEQAERYRNRTNFVDEDGVVRHGDYEGKHIREVPDNYLQAIVERAVSQAIVAQTELDGRSAQMLETLVEAYPELEETLVAHWEANHNVTR